MAGTLVADDALLDDAEALAGADPGEMLPACAGAGAQVRTAARSALEAGVRSVADDGRPRTVVVAGVGGSGIAADALAAVTGPSCPVQVLALHDLVLPGWVGPLDLVVGVSCSGSTEETLLVTEEAARRGARVVTVGRPGSALAAVGERARGVHLPVDAAGRPPRACFWSLSVPLLVLADVLGLAAVPQEALAATAARLDVLAERYGPRLPVGENPAKDLALALAGTLPMVWGTSGVAAAAAYRMVSQLAENAKLPAAPGQLPEAGHNAVVALDGPLSGAGDGAADDLFRDPFEEPQALRLRAVLLRDPTEHPRIAARADAVEAVAQGRGVPTSVLRADGDTAVERLASLVGLADFATTYLALATGVDPSPIAAIDELKARIGEPAR
ncbi:SIS domain-containing protein [Motilibacter aurantiacus]|uniref:SIS domain-containing protein n=1 Tax=Motilibacter aurantiacus TaxID=2714955 RepID=UPI00140E8667|nr:SIS domain-containing protein [Motilibacter aurantiacus]NHC43783.1 mannose-6-phosphate isomerase [Motilibacter aurantiacus]